MRQQDKDMRTVLVVFAVAALLALLTTSCQHATTELGEQLGCHVAGNGCPSVNMDDPNLRGPQGPQGVAGSTGATGPAGTTVREVQLCPGTTTYPTVFVEVALCINNTLYAVYSKNDGFLVRLVPGRYSSNAVGSSCSFTVFPNCEVVP